MYTSLQIIFIFQYVAATFTLFCPPPEILKPCTCNDGVDITIYCYNTYFDWNPVEHFANISEHMDPNLVIEELSIANSNIGEFPRHMTGDLKFKKLRLSFHDRLKNISPDAFNGASSTLRELEIIYSNVYSEPDNELKDIFQLINNFPHLYSVTLRETALTAIPANAFAGPNEYLTELDFTGSKIKAIGDYAFAGLKNLQKLSLSKLDALRVRGISDNAFSGVPDGIEVELKFTSFGYLHDKKFGNLLDAGGILKVGGFDSYYPKKGNTYYTSFHCDFNVNWVCDKVANYTGRITGYSCTGQDEKPDIWDYCNSMLG